MVENGVIDFWLDILRGYAGLISTPHARCAEVDREEGE